ncbi:hypothetical protein [Glaciecola sp. MF2-115]|uniref:hypothetical protein n=1 Tax=Glaciecola sp. MF2-115 TaxID=3384827 RepID=UPI0039A081D3
MLISKFSKLCIALSLSCVAISLQAQTLTDPTRPPGQNQLTLESANATSNTSVNVTAVFKKNEVFYAVINNSWLKKGERMGAWRVTDITQSGVFLKNENEPEAIPLRFLVNEKSDFKKQTNNE